MFTGIITHTGRVRHLDDGAGRRLTITADLPLDDVALGASIAHSGVCLTVVDKGSDCYDVEASKETLDRTTLGSWREGDVVNLECSLKLGDELGGHIVFGHVDGIGRVTGFSPVGADFRLEVSLSAELAPMVAVKGSIAVDGISLTVNEVGDASFAVTILSYTRAHTTLVNKQIGDDVNLEVDMLARYVARQTAFSRQGA